MPRLELNIESGGDTSGGRLAVAGTLRNEDGQELGFVGWVGLLALLEHELVRPANVAADAE